MVNRISRAAAAIAVALLLALPAYSRAADWRPGPPDRLAALDEAMGPLLAQYKPAFDAIVADFSVVGAYPQITTIAAALEDAKARVAAAERLPVDIAYAKSLAHDALAVMDDHPLDQCAADYGAVLRAGWLSYGDSADALEVGAMDDANKYITLAIVLLGTYGELTHTVAVEACAS